MILPQRPPSAVVQNFHVGSTILLTDLFLRDAIVKHILVGELTSVPVPVLDVNQVGKLTIGAAVKNCGLPETCKQNEFAVHLYTGKDNNDEPKICVDGKYVIAKGLNNAGRGLNIVVVSNGKEIIRTGHFDTWQEGWRRRDERCFDYSRCLFRQCELGNVPGKSGRQCARDRGDIRRSVVEVMTSTVLTLADDRETSIHLMILV